MKRSQLLSVIEAALTSGNTRYAREASQQLLAAWPGDLSAQMALARAHAAAGDAQEAIDVFEGVIAIDPERAAAQRGLGELFQHARRLDLAAEAYGTAYVIDGAASPAGLRLPAWAEAGREAVLALRAEDWRTARTNAERAIQAAPAVPLPSLIYLLAAWRPGELDLARPLAEGFHARWPGCVAFSLCLAESLLSGAGAEKLDSAKARLRSRQKYHDRDDDPALPKAAANYTDEARAIALLHEAGALDSAGEVVARYWGESNPYRSLWPPLPDAELPGPLPEDVSRMLGLNRLSEGAGEAESKHKNGRSSAALPEARKEDGKKKKKQEARPPKKPSVNGKVEKLVPAKLPVRPVELADIQAELNRIEAWVENRKARGRKGRGQSAARAKQRLTEEHFSSPATAQPAHVILTSRTRLVQKFGAEAAETVCAQLAQLAQISAKTVGGSAHIVYVDDRDSLRPFDLRPVNAEKPWDVKLLLRDVVAALAKQDKEVTSVLIAGGDDIIPFHRLPNPVDDADGEVPSDNPYATSDENYLIPEWPVGRLPSAAGGDPASFSRLIKMNIAAHHAAIARRPVKTQNGSGPMAVLIRWLGTLLGSPGRLVPRAPNFGYAARVWQKAAEAVYTTIDDVGRLNTCPPLDVTGIPPEGLAAAPLSYFNLHGVEDGPEWYGQREAGDPGLPQFPIALKPSNVANSGRAPGVVFTEACYGTNIFNKGVEDALCLKFLDSGTGSVVGSTKIAYGAVAAPLLGADLLGRLFWDHLKEGLPAGQALQKAKVSHAREMHVRQGFLDGEDQKTLMSFLLLGDPLLPGPEWRPAKTLRKTKRQSRIREDELTLLSEESTATEARVSKPETVAHIKSLVARHVPGMTEPDVHISRQRTVPGAARKGAAGPGRNGRSARAASPAANAGSATGNTVFTLSKTMQAGHTGRRAISQFVRVTVNREGKVIKMAVSK